MGLLDLFAVLIHGGGLELVVKHAAQVGGFGGVDDVDLIGVLPHRQRGGGGVGGEGLRQLGVHLRHRQAKAHGLVLVDDNADFGVAGALAVAHLGDALHAVQLVHDLLGQLQQRIGVFAVDVHLDAAAHHGGHVGHSAAAGKDLAGQVGGDGLNFIGDLVLAAAALGVGEHVVGKAGAGACAGARAHHGVGAVVRHGTHGLNALHAQHPLHQRVGAGVGIGDGGILRQLIGDGELVGAHVGQQHHAAPDHGGDAAHQQHHGHRQRHRLAPQRQTQNFVVAGQHLVKPGVLDVPRFAQDGAAGGGHHRERDEQRCAQTVRDGEGHIHQQLADQTFGEDEGQEHADGGDGAGHDGA